jgi:tetratricopeptide (TPR) repeat protein
MNKAFCVIIICYLLSACTETTDFSNPQSVVEKYYKLKGDYNTEHEYELLADTCRDFATLQDYKNYYLYRDSLKNKFKLSILKIEQLPIDPKLVQYRLYEIHYTLTNKENKDTIKYIAYETVINQNSKWKIIWTKNLTEVAEKLIYSQKSEDGIEVYKEILKYDPLNGNAFLQIGWSQYIQGYYEAAIKNANKAIELNPKNESNYNLLASIYSSQDNKELAIENFNKAIEMALTEDEKVYLLSNLSKTYLDLLDFDKARAALNNALSIDSNFTHAWWYKGMLHEKENNIDSAIVCFKKATTLEPMYNYLQSQLFYSLSSSEYTKAKTGDVNKTNRDILLYDAKNQIIKALDIQPNNEEYKELLNKIKNLK